MNRVLSICAFAISTALFGCSGEPVGSEVETSQDELSFSVRVTDVVTQMRKTKDPTKKVELGAEAAYLLAIDRDFAVRATEGFKDWRLLPSLEGKAYVDANQDVLDELAKVQTKALAPTARLTKRTVETYLNNNLALYASHGFEREFNALFSDAQNMLFMASAFRIETQLDVSTLDLKYRNTGAFFQWRKELLKRAVRLGVQPTKSVIRLQLAQTKGILDAAEADPLSSDFVTSVPLPDAWTDAQKTAAQKKWATAVKTSVVPALKKFVDYMEKELLPSGRADLGVGITPGGAAFYQKSILAQTGQSLTADQVHATGLATVASLEGEIRKVMNADPELRKLLNASKTIGDAIRSIPGRVVTAETFDADIQASMAKVYGKNKALWNIQGADPVIEQDVEGTSPYYMSGAADGSTPGQIYAGPGVVVGNYAPTLMHETTHHLQYLAGLGQKGSFANLVRVAWSNGTVEGEALYAEQLGAEAGVYTTNEEKLQYFGAQLFRAARLVVDTGLHAKGWTRQRAVDYLFAHSSETAASVQSEADRYLSWPGQALGYAIGQKTILDLREEVKTKLGSKYNLEAFNRVMIDAGGVPLDVLQASVRDWAATQ